tara:strand:+ start:2136 stop:3062 length:927 start_codon:yes stop_codon:yes gene_type:complete
MTEEEITFHKVNIVEIDEDFQSTRIDNFLLYKIKNVPKSRIYSMIRKGEVRINGSRCKPEKKLNKGDKVRIPPYKSVKNFIQKPKKSLIELIKENIIFEDNSILAINKPEGLASHGGSGLSLGLIESVRQIDSKYSDAHLVHRLDRNTSGIMILAKKRSALRRLNEEIRQGNVEKKYIAIVFGNWPKNIKRIDKKLLKNELRSGEREVTVNEEGKESLTLVDLLETNKKFSKLECKLITGRTHQIRVHLKSEGFPIVGDEKYGYKDKNKLIKKQGINRMLLHSKTLKFPQLDLDFTAEEPNEFRTLFL